jgi:hypothetical protein
MLRLTLILLVCLAPVNHDILAAEKAPTSTDEVITTTQAFYNALFQGDVKSLHTFTTINSPEPADLDVLDAMASACKDLDQMNNAFMARYPKEQPLVLLPDASNIRARMSVSKIEIKGGSAMITYQKNVVLELANVEHKWRVIPESVPELKGASVKGAHELSTAAADIKKRIDSRELTTPEAIQQAWGEMLKPAAILANQIAKQASAEGIMISGSGSETVPGGEIEDFEAENLLPGVATKTRVLTLLILTPHGQPASTNEGGSNEKGIYTEELTYQTGPNTTKSLTIQLNPAQNTITIGSEKSKFKIGDILLVKVDGEWKSKTEQFNDTNLNDLPKLAKERIHQRFQSR